MAEIIKALKTPVKPYLTTTLRQKFALVSVTPQDICRYYKIDFWGHLHRYLDTKGHLSRRLFSRTLRRSRRQQMINSLRAGRYELLKLDDQRYVPKKRIPKFYTLIHNKERFRLYWRVSEKVFRSMAFPIRSTGRAVPQVAARQSRFAARLDQFLFANRFTPTLLSARKLIRQAIFTLNGNLVRRYDHMINFMDLFEFRSLAGRTIFFKHRRAWFKRLASTVLTTYKRSFQLLIRARKVLRKPRGRRTRFAPYWYRGLRKFRRFRRPDREAVFRTPKPYRFLSRHNKAIKAMVQTISGGKGELLGTLHARLLALALAPSETNETVNEIIPKKIAYTLNYVAQKPTANSLGPVRREILVGTLGQLFSTTVFRKRRQASWISWLATLARYSSRIVRAYLHSDFFQSCRASLKIKPLLKAQLFSKKPFFVYFLRVPGRTYYPCRGGTTERVLRLYGRERTRRLLNNTAVASIAYLSACAL